MKLSRIIFVAAAILSAILISLQAGSTSCFEESLGIQQRETVLDRIPHIETEVHLEIPPVSRWCDRLDLKKSKVNVGDCELYVEEEGMGVPIVLLHGGPGGTHHGFHPEFSRAKSFARLIYYDQRGCGLSDYKKGPGYTIAQAVDDLENLRRALYIGKWVVLGWSYGGLLAQRYALKYPENLSGLILVAAGTGIPPARMGETRQNDYILPEEKQRMAEVSLAIAKAAKEGGWSPEKTMELTIYNRHLNGDWKRQHFYKPTPDEFASGALYEWKQDADFNTVMSQDQRKLNLNGAFENCPIPTLIFEAKWDLTWTPEKIEVIHRNHPGSRLVVLERAGHVLFRDEPERFFSELKSFVEGSPPVPSEKIASWKEYLAVWEKEKKKEDPLLVAPMSDAEAKAMGEFQEIRKKIEAGGRYENSSTPLRTFLSFLSALRHRDGEALQRIDYRGRAFSSQDLESWEGELANRDILRAPAPPDVPEEGTVWPVFLKDRAKNALADTYIFGYGHGHWMRIGNVGGPSDWRLSAARFKEAFMSVIKKGP